MTDIASHRRYLLAVANKTLPGWLRPRLDPDDMVQQTFMEALQAGLSTPDRPYLVQALRNNIRNAIRDNNAGKRAMSLENGTAADALAREPGTPAPSRPRRPRKVSPEAFVSAWQASKSLEDFMAKTAMSRQAAYCRAGAYRKMGIPLKKLTAFVLDVERLKKLAAESLKECP